MVSAVEPEFVAVAVRTVAPLVLDADSLDSGLIESMAPVRASGAVRLRPSSLYMAPTSTTATSTAGAFSPGA